MRLFKWLFGVSLVIAALMFLADATMAATVRSDEVSVVTAGETVNDDLFVKGELVRIEGVVNGDVFVAGGRIKVSGVVNGDVFAAGEDVEISGQIRDDVQVAAQRIDLSNAKIGGSALMFGQTAALSDQTTLGGGIVFAGQILDMQGQLGRGIMAAGQSVIINGAVGAASHLGVETLQVGERANLAADIQYRADADAQIADGALIQGELIRIPQEQADMLAGWARLRAGFAIWSYLGALLVGLALLAVSARRVGVVADVLEQRPGPAMGWGLVGIIAGVIITAGLSVTIVGIPLALILGAKLLIAIYLAKIFVGVALGRRLLTYFKYRDGNIFVAFVVGLSFLYLFQLVPIISALVGFLTMLAGLGALIIVIKPHVLARKTKK